MSETPEGYLSYFNRELFQTPEVLVGGTSFYIKVGKSVSTLDIEKLTALKMYISQHKDRLHTDNGLVISALMPVNIESRKSLGIKSFDTSVTMPEIFDNDFSGLQLNCDAEGENFTLQNHTNNPISLKGLEQVANIAPDEVKDIKMSEAVSIGVDLFPARSEDEKAYLCLMTS